MSQTLSYPAQQIQYSDGSTGTIGVDVTVDFTPAPPPPVQPAVAVDRFRIGDSCKSVTGIPQWPGAERGFGLLFNSPTHGFDLPTFQAALAQFPDCLWCVCEKDDPAVGLGDAIDAVPGTVEWWYAFQQEENPTFDPATYIAAMHEARNIIDSKGKPVKIVNKLAGYAALHPGSGHQWTEYISGVEDVFGLDHYVRPGVGWPTTSYPTPDQVWALAEDVRDTTGKDVAITEHAQLAISSDTTGSGLADSYSANVGYLRNNGFLLVSFWLGKATSLRNPDGTLVDFMPPAGPAQQAVRSLIMSQ